MKKEEIRAIDIEDKKRLIVSGVNQTFFLSTNHLTKMQILFCIFIALNLCQADSKAQHHKIQFQKIIYP